MRLVYVVSRWGEPTETFVRREIDAALDAGHHVQVVSLKPPRPTVRQMERVLHHGTVVTTLRAIAAAARRPSRAMKLLSLLRGSSRRNLPRHFFALAIALSVTEDLDGPDWIHSHFAWLSATTAWGLSTLLEVPFGVMPHAHDIYEHALVDELLRAKLGAASLVVVESDRIKADVAASLGVDPLVLRMGVPDHYVNPEHSGSGSGAAVVSVGALRPKKGHDLLIRAAAGVPGAQLRIVGDGPERPRLEALMTELGLSDRVTLLGHVSEDTVASELDAADVFALASRVTRQGDRDGVPNVLIEAMARGLPVVSTDVAGIPDLLGDGRGTVVPSDNEPALRDAIATLLDDVELRATQVRNASDHVAEHYTVGTNWTKLERMIIRARGLDPA